MRRWIWACVVLVVLAIAYWVWPFVGAEELARAARSGDAQEVISRVDIPALRRSLARQISSAYLKATGRAEKLGAFGRSVVGAAATTVADPYVAQLLTPENITALLQQGKIARVSVGGKTLAVDRELPGFTGLFNSDALSLVTGSYFDGIASFVIPARSGAGADDEYRVHMRLDGLTWRLSGLDLPPPLVETMARSIIEAEKQPTP